MIESIINNYLPAIIVIIGMVQFFKNIEKKGFKKKHILQIFFSLLWAIKTSGINSKWFVEIPWLWITMIALSTLFWDFVFKKIQNFKKDKENEK